jgi:hypothetical protein
MGIVAQDHQSSVNKYRLGVYELILIKDKDTIFTARYDSVLFADARQIGHVYELFAGDFGGDRVQRLYRKPFVTAYPFNSKYSGMVNLKEDELALFTVLVKDFHGNTSSLRFRAKGEAKISSINKKSSSVNSFGIRYFDWGAAILYPDGADRKKMDITLLTDSSSGEFEPVAQRDGENYISFRAKPNDIARLRWFNGRHFIYLY